MAISKVTAEFQSDVKKVWNIVASLENYEWRSDLSKIEVLEPEKIFEEYTKNGFVTKFTITAYEPYGKYEFDMENENMPGCWSGIFTLQNGRTVIEFTENVTAKRILMKPFVKQYLKKQQKEYIQDLKRALGE